MAPAAPVSALAVRAVPGAMRIAPGVTGIPGPSVIDVAAIAEAAAVAVPMPRDDCVGIVHEAGRLAPAALVEIAGRAVVVARVWDMAAMCGAADRVGLVASGHEVGDERLEPACKVAGHRYRPGRGGHPHQSAAFVRPGCVCCALMVNVRVGVGLPVMAMSGLGLDGAQGKDRCRYQQSHTQYLFSCCSLDALPEGSCPRAAQGAAALAGLPLQAAVVRIRDAGAPDGSYVEIQMRQLQGSS